MKPISKQEMKTLLKSQQGELDAVLMYNALAKKVTDTKDKETFRKLAAEEGHHAAVFYALTDKKLKPKRTKAVLLPILYSILGKKRLYPLIAKGEYAAVEIYAPVADRFPTVESVKNDEKRHGDIVNSLIWR